MIKTALLFRISPRRIRDTLSVTDRQIQYARTHRATPKKARGGRAGVKISTPKREEMKRWLLASPSHRHIPFSYLPALAPELHLDNCGFEAIRTGFREIGFGRRVAKRKGFSDNPVVMARHVQFAKEGLTWSRERLRQQAFSDEIWAHGGAFTQSYVTVLVEGETADIQKDRYAPGCVQHKYSKLPSWMFNGTIYDGKKGPAVFWEKEWGYMDSRKYNLVVLARIQAWLEEERAQGKRYIWQQDGASCHRSFETWDNLYRRNILTIDWPPYSPDLNLIEHVWSWMRRYIQRHYFNAHYDPSKIPLEELRAIVWEAWNAVPESYIEGLYDSWYERCQAVIDAQGGPTRY